MQWQTARFRIDLGSPKVMGIVNVTPDSFSDGGQHALATAALAHCEQLLAHGADMLDIGGESTRPGAVPVPLEEELSRVLPVVRHAVTLGVPISVDTYKPHVMQAVLDLGADIINDVWALRWVGENATPTITPTSAGDVLAQHPQCGVCLMHMHRQPQTMQVQPMQGDVVAQVLDFLRERVSYASALGIAQERICIDPGIGFGKTVPQNFSLLAQQHRLATLGLPLLAGWSRKSSLAAVTSTAAPALNAADRLVPSTTAALIAVQNGAHIVRVHDVKETVQALKVWAAVQAAASDN